MVLHESNHWKIVAKAIVMVLADDEVYRVADKHGRKQRSRDADERAYHRDEQQKTVRSHVFQQAFYEFFGRHVHLAFSSLLTCERHISRYTSQESKSSS